jgi:hypothetical protein
MTHARRITLILGSGPNAKDCTSWSGELFTDIVAINNAWQVRSDWTHLIHPEDFPAERRPQQVTTSQSIVTASDYVPLQNTQGGFVYAGGTMAFTAGYWALAALKPDIMAFLGCDMVYPSSGRTHFYGTGTADPLRADVTLQNLEGKAARLFLHAQAQGCHCVNLSGDKSRLVFPRSNPKDLSGMARPHGTDVNVVMAPALKREADLGYFVPSGRYWEVEDSFDAKELAALDQLWLNAFEKQMNDLPA